MANNTESMGILEVSENKIFHLVVELIDAIMI